MYGALINDVFFSKMQDHLWKKADGDEEIDDKPKTSVTDPSTLTIDDIIQIPTVAEDSMMKADGMLEEDCLMRKRIKIDVGTVSRRAATQTKVMNQCLRFFSCSYQKKRATRN